MRAVVAGEALPVFEAVIDRTQLVRYAGASGDFNPIHHSDYAARALGLDGVIAHGMLTMGVALRAVTQWCGDPAAIRRYQTKFSKPVLVPDDGEGARVRVAGVVERIDNGLATVALTVEDGGGAVLSGARVEVCLD